MKVKNGRLWGTKTTRNGQVEIRTVTKETLEAALDVLDGSFFINESVCNACEINLPESVQARTELRELCRLTAIDGVSLAAFDAATGDVVAVSFNKIQYVPLGGEEPFFVKFRNERTHSPQAQTLMDFMISVDGENDVFDLYDCDCVCELMFLATLPRWECLGIARTLASYTIDLARELSQGIGLDDVHPSLATKRPHAVTALWTSQFSQKIGQVLGFKVLNVVQYTNYRYSGKTFDERINPLHKNCQHAIYLL